MKHLGNICLLLFLNANLCLAGSSNQIENPDFTKGEKPQRLRSYSMGPTGFEGWFAHSNYDSDISRQIMVTLVEAKSPADGLLKKGDVILGADGKGAAKELSRFTTDARKAIAAAISDAEAKTPALLRLLRWRSADGAQGSKGKTEVVTLKLKTMGVYSDTAPYNCPKSKEIMDKGIQKFYENGNAGLGSIGALLLMAANDPSNPNNKKYQEKAREWVYELIPDENMMEIMLDDFSKISSSKPAWSHAYSLIVLCEYYLQTKDKKVLPAIEAYAVCFAKGQSWFGTTGHKYSFKRPDGGFNGPMAGYGAINASGISGFLGLSLARECGLKNPEIAEGIKRADAFFGHFAFKGVIGYGEQGPGLGNMSYDSNGKMGETALALMLQPNRLKEAHYFARMTACSSYTRGSSHAGPYFNYVWPILGAASASEELAQHYFRRTQWDYDLARQWDGSFTFSPLNAGNGGSGRLPSELTALLAYTLPLKQLYITGRGHDKSKFIDTKQIKETIAADEYNPKDRSADQLLKDLNNWSPKVCYSALVELESRGNIEKYFPLFKKMATDQSNSKTLRATACMALGIIGDKLSADILVSLLEEKDSWVRYAAVYALRRMPDELRRNYTNDFLRAVVTMARPAFPIDPEDPLQQAQGELAELIFYAGRAAVKGIFAKGIDGVDRSLLIPAIKAVAKHPAGHNRGSISYIYSKLTDAEVLELAPAIVETVRNMSPADSMFSTNIRIAGSQLLQKRNIAEGVPLCKEFAYRSSRAFQTLAAYGGSALSVTPDSGILDFIYESYYHFGMPEARDALNAIVKDTNYAPLKPLKVIHSITPDKVEIKLPSRETTLHVKATNYAVEEEEETFYTWKKLHGAGSVTFKPNGTWESKETTVSFVGGSPGKYRFEVTMSDVLGYTEVQKTVDITLTDETGTLPPNKPAVANNQSLQAIPGVPLPIILNGSDPDGDQIAFRIKTFPSHGTLSGNVPSMTYTAHLGYTGTDTCVFEVVDGQGEISDGTINFSVRPGKLTVTLYEGFAYPEGDLINKSEGGSFGFAGAWSTVEKRAKYTVVSNSLSYDNLPSSGGKLTASGGRRAKAVRKLNSDAFIQDGLFENGGELWFCVIGKRSNHNGALNLELTEGIDGTKQGVGVFWKTASLDAMINGVSGKSEVSLDDQPLHGKPQVAFPLNEPSMFLGHCVWGKSAQDSDTVSIYRVVKDQQKQVVVLQKPISVQRAVVDQKKLDTLLLNYGGGCEVDEIRIGPSRESVLLGTIASKGK